MNVDFSNIVVWLLLSAAHWEEWLTCLELWLWDLQPFSSIILAEALHLFLSTGQDQLILDLSILENTENNMV